MLPEDAESLPKHWPFARPGATSSRPKSDDSKDDKADVKINMNSSSTYTTTPATLGPGGGSSSNNNTGTVGSYESNSTPAASTEDSDPAGKETKVSEETDGVRGGGARARAVRPALFPSFSTFDSGSRHSSGSSSSSSSSSSSDDDDGSDSDDDTAGVEAVGRRESQQAQEKQEKQMLV